MMTPLPIPERASEWLLALTEAPDDRALQRRFQAWLAADPAHARDWQEMENTYRLMGMTMPVLRAQWDRPSRRRPLAVAAALLVAACLALVAAPGLLLRFQADSLTNVAETRVLTLPDGSTVHLAPDSAVAVDVTADQRRVRLLTGEAFFEVTPDAAHPFVVAAGSVETMVLGTAFDVRRGASGTWVGVQSGHVRVTDTAGPGRAEDLRAGDWVGMAPGGDASRGRLPPEQVASWTQGDLIVQGATVADAVAALRPYFRGAIVLRGETLARQPLTGLYRLNDPAEALRAIAEAQGARVRDFSPWLLVISGE